jgi:hypothetical protein
MVLTVGRVVRLTGVKRILVHKNFTPARLKNPLSGRELSALGQPAYLMAGI